MKILWLCNILLPHIAEKVGLKSNPKEGWLVGAYERIQNTGEVDIVYLFPHNGAEVHYEENNNIFLSYPQRKQEKLEQEQIAVFKRILREHNPDVVHIFGTEYPHALAMVYACEALNMLERIVVGIQGMVSVIPEHYFAFLPYKARIAMTFRDLLRAENLYVKKNVFVKRGIFEQEVLRKVQHVIGRTEWDYACTKQINPKISYHFCNETLRPSFYEKRWDLESIEKHSIFQAQGQYSLKGFHYTLKAMREIIKIYPDAKLYTTGKNPLKPSLKEKIRRTYYQKYIAKLIRKYGLEDHVVFLGSLSEKEMCARLLKSHVFVSASSIENSSNALGEAMLLGVPSVCSFVGGTPSMLEHEKEGFLYQENATYMLAYYIMRMFEEGNGVLRFSENARKRAMITHSPDKNTKRTIEIYQTIYSKEK